MRLTFAQARTELADSAPANQLDKRINRAIEKILLHGKYVGSMHQLALVARYGQITLPRWYRTIEGVRVGGTVIDIFNHWWRFLQGQTSYSGFSMRGIRDLEDGWATMYDLPQGDDITVSYDGDETIDVTLYGTDAEGFPRTQRFSGAGTQANGFSHIDRIHKEASEVPVKVDHVAADLTETPLAWMDPEETDSYYRRYIDDGLSTTASTQVEALAKLRFIPLVNDDDVLPIHNVNGLDLAMKSLQYYAEDDQVRAAQYLNDAVDLMNKELSDNNASTVPAIRINYVGGHPNMTSHY